MDDTDIRPTEGTDGPAPAAPTEQTVSTAEFAAAWNRSTYQVQVWLRAGIIEGAYRDRNRWHIPARHLPWMPGAKLPSAGKPGGLG